MPEPSPRPSRLRGLREPGFGRQVVQADSSGSMRAIESFALDLDQVLDDAEHAPAAAAMSLRVDCLADPPELQRAQRVALLRAGAVGRADLLEASTSAIGLLDGASARVTPRRPGERRLAPAAALGCGSPRRRRPQRRLAGAATGSAARPVVRGRFVALPSVEPEHLPDREAAQLGDLLGPAQAGQPVHRRLDQVDRVLGADALGEHVADRRRARARRGRRRRRSRRYRGWPGAGRRGRRRSGR